MNLIKAVKQKLSNSLGFYDRYQMSEFRLSIYDGITDLEYIEGSSKLIVNFDDALTQVIDVNNANDVIEILNGFNFNEVMDYNFNRHLIPSNVYNIMMDLMNKQTIFLETHRDKFDTRTTTIDYDLKSKSDTIIILSISNRSYIFHFKSMKLDGINVSN